MNRSFKTSFVVQLNITMHNAAYEKIVIHFGWTEVEALQ